MTKVCGLGNMQIKKMKREKQEKLEEIEEIVGMRFCFRRISLKGQHPNHGVLLFAVALFLISFFFLAHDKLRFTGVLFPQTQSLLPISIPISSVPISRCVRASL